MRGKVIVSLLLVIGLAVLAAVAFVSVIGEIPTDSVSDQQVITDELYLNRK